MLNINISQDFNVQDIDNITKQAMNILQDINNIQSKNGNLIKIVISNKYKHYEISIGNSLIRINSYKPEDY